MMREFYIQAAASGDSLTRDIKELIPDAVLRRRMSRVVKCGVAAGMECLLDSGTDADAIITASGFGCLQDSEKFLRSVVDNSEQQITPTPFIQSTFNTIGAQIALLGGNNSYNMTYSHGGDGFSHVLADAAMMLNEGSAGNILAGVADEITPTLGTILGRLNIKYRLEEGEHAVFFMLSAERNGKSIAAVELRDEAGRGLWTGGWADHRFFPVYHARNMLDALNDCPRGGCAEVRVGSQGMFNTAIIRCL